MNVGPFEVIVFLVIVLLLFGANKLPKLARSVGEASKEFKKGVAEASQDKPAEPGADGKLADDKVTMTRAELDAMLAEREAQARQAGPANPAGPAGAAKDAPPTP